jgi:hypothetical protein
MNLSMQPQGTAFPGGTVLRAALAAAMAIALLVVGYSAPVERVLAHESPPEAADTQYGNGPTGYFPDLFVAAARAAEPAEPIDSF